MRAAMRQAQYEKSEEDGWLATIPGFKGLWASGATIEDAREDLYSALDGWIAVHLLIGKNSLPEIDGISPNHAKKASGA